MDKLIVRHHLSYGQRYYYPINEFAKKWLEFLNLGGHHRKCFTNSELKFLRDEMKFEIEIQTVPIDSELN